jgi:cysteine desulfurase / selenocysteine lyase
MITGGGTMPETREQSGTNAFDVARLRGQFPALDQQVHGKPLVYLDNAATTQKPERVIQAVSDFYRTSNANVHRGLHELSVRATRLYEAARVEVAGFIGASEPAECIFTSGVTDSINLLAYTLGRSRLGEGDRVLLTGMEHHSNIVPWQIACDQVGASIDVIPVTDTGELDLAAASDLIGPRTKVVSCVYVSNTLGTVNDVASVCALARDAGALSVVDAAQAGAHVPIDVQKIGCDFLALSGHKMYGPTGIGVLYGKLGLLADLPPFRGGGEMIETVSFAGSTYAAPPARFEAGTPNIAGAVGLAEAVRFVDSLDRQAVHAHEMALLEHATRRLSAIEGLRLIGTAEDKIPILTFVIEGVHPYDLAPVLDHYGVAIRTGHHCTQPLMERFGVTAAARASLTAYNTLDEVDIFVDALERAKKMLTA